MTKYTHFILTVIAILLTLHLVRPWFIPSDVNISQVAGRNVSVGLMGLGSGIPVFITE